MGRYVTTKDHKDALDRERARTKVAREEVGKLEVDLKGLERFRDLRTRHNDEMQKRTSQLLKAEADLKEALESHREATVDVAALSEGIAQIRAERDETKAENERLQEAIKPIIAWTKAKTTGFGPAFTGAFEAARQLDLRPTPPRHSMACAALHPMYDHACDCGLEEKLDQQSTVKDSLTVEQPSQKSADSDRPPEFCVAYGYDNMWLAGPFSTAEEALNEVSLYTPDHADARAHRVRYSSPTDFLPTPDNIVEWMDEHAADEGYEHDGDEMHVIENAEKAREDLELWADKHVTVSIERWVGDRLEHEGGES